MPQETATYLTELATTKKSESTSSNQKLSQRTGKWANLTRQMDGEETEYK
jgi:hypothetical protein